MPISDPRDRFFYPHHKHMKDTLIFLDTIYPKYVEINASKTVHLFIVPKLINFTVKILKFGTPQTIAIIVLNIEKFDVTLH